MRRPRLQRLRRWCSVMAGAEGEAQAVTALIEAEPAAPSLLGLLVSACTRTTPMDACQTRESGSTELPLLHPPLPTTLACSSPRPCSSERAAAAAVAVALAVALAVAVASSAPPLSLRPPRWFGYQQLSDVAPAVALGVSIKPCCRWRRLSGCPLRPLDAAPPLLLQLQRSHFRRALPTPPPPPPPRLP